MQNLLPDYRLFRSEKSRKTVAASGLQPQQLDKHHGAKRHFTITGTSLFRVVSSENPYGSPLELGAGARAEHSESRPLTASRTG